MDSAFDLFILTIVCMWSFIAVTMFFDSSETVPFRWLWSILWPLIAVALFIHAILFYLSRKLK